MNKILIKCIALFFFSLPALGQIETVVVNEEKSAYENKSYLIVEQLVLGPGFTVSGSTGDFYARPVDRQKNIVPSANKNYIRTETFAVQGVRTHAEASSMPVGKDKRVGVSYVDGLGRPLQSIQVETTPNGKDLVQYQEFDEFGRQVKQYLPYAVYANGGQYRSISGTTIENYYGALKNDTRPYSTTLLEDSPLNRPIGQYDPGEIWAANDKKKETVLRVNFGTGIFDWEVNGNTIQANRYYPPKSFIIQESIDEDGRRSEEYVNSLGQTILVRTQETPGAWTETYSVYDELGNLRFVITPEMTEQIKNEFVKMPYVPSSTLVNRFAFQYEYDNKQRLIKKKLPGEERGWEYFIYDQWDRQVLYQDAKMRAEGGARYWKFTKYDMFNRPIIEGFYNSGVFLTVGDELVGGHHELSNSTGLGYSTNLSFPSITSSNQSLHDPVYISATYYDDYSFLGNTNWDTEGHNFSFVNEPDINATKFNNVKGQVTGAKTRVLPEGIWLNSVNYYDKYYRNIQTISENHLGGTDKMSNEYDFIGNVLKTKRKHSTSLASFTSLETFEYDHGDRLIKSYHSLTGSPSVLVAENSYNEIGELIETNHYSPHGYRLQSEDFRYNIRGWLTNINNSELKSDAGTTNDDADDLFGMNLLYHDAVSINGLTPEPRYNGNIAAWKWNTNNDQGYSEERIYGYSYDLLERLESATYATKSGASWNGDANGYNVTISGYDKNGNIQGIQRNALNNGMAEAIDNLGYRYDGNVLKNVIDHTDNDLGFKDLAGSPITLTEYMYDANGNMTQDLNKGITDVDYNYLNLPTRVELDTREIIYQYDAAGMKISSEAIDNGTTINKTDYVGGVHYVNDELAFISIPGGRAVKRGNRWDYEYFLTDHLGNVRVTYGYTNEIDEYLATMEQENYNQESQEFTDIALPHSSSFNHTAPTLDLQNPDESLLLHGASTRHSGAGKGFEVKAGDKVTMTVYARYIPQSGNANDIVNNVVSAVSGTLGVTSATEGGRVLDGFNNYLQPFVNGINAGPRPKAYINYILFNHDFSEVSFGYDRIGMEAATGFQELSVPVDITADGYIYIYLANESSYDVYFDDLHIVHDKYEQNLELTQSNDYYPFGLTFNQYQATQDHENRYQFQGQELQTDFDLGWSQFKWRNSDPAIGRFFNVDPLSEDYYYNSPYAFSENRLTDGIELEGLEFIPTTDEEWVQGMATGVDGASSTAIQTGSGGLLYRGYLSQVFQPVNRFLSYVDGQIEQGLTQVFRSITGSITPNNTLSQSQFERAFASGDEAAFFAGFEEDFTILYNSSPETTTLVTRTLVASAFSNYFGNRSSFTRSNRQNRIALGVTEHLDEFAGLVKGSTWKTWGTEDFMNQFLNKIHNPSTQIHFNLDGPYGEPLNVWQAVQEGSRGLDMSRATSWELYQLYNTPDALQRTTFYLNGNVTTSPF